MDAVDLSTVIERLGPILISTSVGDARTPVTSVSILDRAHPAELRAGALALAVGYTSHEAAFLSLCAEAVVAGVAGLLVKGLEAPEVPGPPVLVVDLSADWAQLAQLIRSAAVLHQADGLDLFDVAETLSVLAGGPVVVHDSAWELVTYSRAQPSDPVRQETILGRSPPRHLIKRLFEDGYVERLERGEIVHVHQGEITGMSERYAAGVTLGEQFLGSVWVLLPANFDQAAARDALRRAVDVAALPLMRHLTNQQAILGTRELAFRSLLEGRRTERLLAEHLAGVANAGYVLAAFRPTNMIAVRRENESQRLISITQSYLSAFGISAVAAALDGIVYILFVVTKNRLAITQAVSSIHDRIMTAIPHRAVIGETFLSVYEAMAAKVDADGLLDLAHRKEWAGVSDAETLESARRLEQFRAAAAGKTELKQGAIARLIEYDALKGSALVPTLRAWLSTVGDTRHTSELLNLHVNSVRYRLRQAEQIGGFTLDNADDRLLIQLQLLVN